MTATSLRLFFKPCRQAVRFARVRWAAALRRL
jgi:hypothetical protein